MTYRGRLCAIPQPVPQGMSQASLRDAYFSTLADHEECQRRTARLGPRASRSELYALEQRLRTIRSLLGEGQLDTLPFVPGSMAERESRIYAGMAGMG